MSIIEQQLTLNNYMYYLDMFKDEWDKDKSRAVNIQNIFLNRLNESDKNFVISIMQETNSACKKCGSTNISKVTKIVCNDCGEENEYKKI